MLKSLLTNLVSGTHPPNEDRLLDRKITWRIVPFLFACFVVLFLERINVGFAQLQMKHDLGFTDAMYGLAAGVFYLGYVICEVPSNMLLARFGARKTFSRIMLFSGIMAMSTMLASTPSAYFALRFMLGVFEAGFFPGIILYMTYWFPPHRRAGIMSVFIAGVATAGMLGGLFSGWIMRDMNGMLGLFGWQWMFALEGLPAVALGLVARVCLADSPAEAKWLSEAEKTRLGALLAAPASAARASGARGTHSIAANPMVYLFAFVYFTLTCASLTLNFWLPLMIRDFGVDDVALVSLYSVVPNAIGVVGLIVIAKHSDRTRERRWHFLLCTAGGAVALGALTLHPHSLVALLGWLTVACVSIYAALPVFWAVPPTHFAARDTAAGIALVSSIGITSGIVNPWALGIVRSRTGSLDDAIYVLAPLLLLSGIVLLAAVKPARRSDKAA
ncbi:MFS transporter [Caballeronia sp. LZ065]|uniref:MFS transporter n=1 Tax=Caballeronia sp. LZ065 TaxID=3038571 RepID=UPI0028638473|nr:MFS transporter [Caballeronia sp. LZ065]MDR5782400.1 MFS transporter [Caballeronia sp. LZ065]